MRARERAAYRFQRVPPVALTDSRLVRLDFGDGQQFACEIREERIVAFHAAPQPNPNFVDELREALAHPLEFPPLELAVIPDDRVTIAVDRDTPEVATIVAAVWERLALRKVAPENIVIVQPLSSDGSKPADPRAALPDSVREQVIWKIHENAERQDLAYLASSSTGERVYLDRDIVDAGAVVAIGTVAYDPLMGYRGTNSVFFPGMSSPDAISRARGQGHTELRPDDDRPLRQVVDEIGWLLGMPFFVQVIPAAGGGVAHVLAGAAEFVLRRGKELLAQEWLVELEARPEIVVAAVDRDAGGHGWEQVGSALAAARNLVAHGGRIILLTDLDAELGPGMEIVRGSAQPKEAFRPLRQAAPPDLISATQLAQAAEWADVYLLSRLPGDVVEDLFIIPLDSAEEASRLLRGDQTCAFLASAQKTHGQIA